MSYVIALYIRLSMEDSKYDSMSISNQQLILRKKAMSLPEWEQAEILEFVDNGYTGTNFERPAFQELLAQVQDGHINCILVKDLSRFGRNSIETGYFMERVFPLYHVRFISVGDDYDSDNFKGTTGGIEVAFKYLINEAYSRDMSMKTRSAKYAKMRRGEYQSVICPYGYQKGANGKMEPNPETAPIVRQIFTWAGENVSGAEIARRLTLRHIPTPGEYRVAKRNMNYPVDRVKGVWTISSVLRILTDERYTGMYIMCRKTVKEIGANTSRWRDESEWIKIPDQHPALVDAELFRRVNEKRRHFTIPKKNPRDYLLKGKVICGYCDHALFRGGKGNHVHFYCRYSTKLSDMPCYGLSIRASELEQAVFSSVKSQLMLFLENDEEEASFSQQSKELAAYESRLLDLQTKKRRLYEQCIIGGMDYEQMEAEKKSLDSEMARITDSLTVLREMEKKNQDTAQARQTFRAMLHEICEADHLTASVADRLIDKVYIFHGHRIEIVYAMQNVWGQAGFCVSETQNGEKK